jgi:tetratricopeptide (TPR) repeat protein
VATELGLAAIPLLEHFVERQPQNATAHRYLSELQSEAGAQERSTDSYLAAIESFPNDRALRLSYWDTLVRSGRHAQALEAMEEAKGLFADDRRFALLKLDIAMQMGSKSLAGQLLDQLGDQPDTRLARAQYLLQLGQVDQAGRHLERLLAAEPDNVTAWAMIELVWRMLADPRHEWLIGSRPLFDVLDLQLSTTELRGIADALRRLHLGRSQPIGQSVRAGTQTSGQLFLRSDPEILKLMGAIEEAVGRFVRGLPAFDARHPVLKFRNSALTYGPSWSVRLTEQGYHAAHFHPGGVWSSACYIAVADPEDVSDHAGWLELGRPPPELVADVEPLAVLQPKAGRLVLFPSFLFHGTRPFQGEERLTVAFDLVPVSPR